MRVLKKLTVSWKVRMPNFREDEDVTVEGVGWRRPRVQHDGWGPYTLIRFLMDASGRDVFGGGERKVCVGGGKEGMIKKGDRE